MKPLLLLTLLSAAPAALAQQPSIFDPVPQAPKPASTAAPFDASRLYVALLPAYIGYPPGRVTSDVSPGLSHFYPIGLSAGCWLGKPTALRLALEFNYTARLPTTETLEDANYRTTFRARAQAFTLLGRLAFPPLSASGRWGAEAAMGLTRYLASEELESRLRSTGGSGSVERYSTADVQLLVGLSPSYELAPHWQLTGDLRVQVSALGQVIGHGVGGGIALGTRYRL